ncbi:hypothetical protein MNV49_000988 [Pseudohyphozyma bogoriensis]|nr:hypothetical protein MNV49_000988 [Pseudohyphozyma bogoriensis]
MLFDCLIIGSGAAGLSTALALCRVVRRSAVFDTMVHRNRFAPRMHTIPTWYFGPLAQSLQSTSTDEVDRDHAEPATYRQTARKEIEDRYPGLVTFTGTGVTTVKKTETGTFELQDRDGQTWHGKKLVLAVGSQDLFPPIEGYESCWGQRIYQCLFCDG